MSKKVMLVALSIALAAALVGGATMAWFTDSEATDTVEFTAGTVQIEAGALVPAPSAEMGYGWKLVNVFPEEVVSAAQGTRPNGAAVQPARSNPNAVLDLEQGSSARNFYSMGFNMDGQHDEPGDADAQEYWLKRGGEIVVRFAEKIWVSDGRLVLVVEDTWGNWPLEKAEVYVSQNGSDWTFVDYAINGIGSPQSYNNINVSAEVVWFRYVKVIDISNPYDFKNWNADDNDGFDLNAIMVQRWEKENWNPGDCDEISYIVRNSGTKRSNVRAKFSGYWMEYDEESGEWVRWTPPADVESNVVTFGPCDGTPWVEHGEDGYLYYTAVLETNDTAELCLKVCLSGPETSNEFQGKRFVVTGEFEAIQASNNAPYYEWGVSLNGTP